MARRRRSPLLVPTACAAAGALGALGGARPTGMTGVDALLLGAMGVAFGRAAIEARSMPLFAACAVASVVQPSVVPLGLGVLGMLCVLVRAQPWAGQPVAAAAGGLFWAAAVGAPFEPGGRPQVLPLAVGVVVLASARRHGPRDFRLWFDRTATAVGCSTLVVGGLAALSVINARTHLERSVDLLEQGLDAARSGDTTAAVDDLQAARRVLQRGDRSLGAAWAQPSLLVPGLSQNFRALQTAVDEVIGLSTAAIQASREADVDNLRVGQGQLDLDAVERMEEPLAILLDELEGADSELTEVEDQWLVPFVRDRLDELHDEIRDGIGPARLALRAVRTAPAILGGDGARTYLVLFTTPVEARATTGFPGNYALLDFVDGRFTMTEFGRSEDLNRALPAGARLTALDEYLRRYDRFRPSADWRNVPVSPDFPTVAEAARQLWEQSGRERLDGVLSIDTTGLAALLALTGPIEVPGVEVPLGPDNAAAYLNLDQYVELTDTPERIDTLERLAESAVARFLAIDLPGPRELGDLLGPVVADGHLQVVTFSAPEVELFDELGLSGRYPVVDGDFLGVTTSNAGGSKVDVFLRRELRYDAVWDPDSGALRATATLTLHNDAPAGGLPDYVLGNAQGGRVGAPAIPVGGNLTFLTLYTPWLPDGPTLDGAPVPVEVNDELGRRAVSLFVLIPPGESRRLVVPLRGQLAGPVYRLGLGRQPLVTPERAAVSVVAAGAAGLRAAGPVEVRGDGVVGTFALVRPTVVTVTVG